MGILLVDDRAIWKLVIWSHILLCQIFRVLSRQNHTVPPLVHVSFVRCICLRSCLVLIVQGHGQLVLRRTWIVGNLLLVLVRIGDQIWGSNDIVVIKLWAAVGGLLLIWLTLQKTIILRLRIAITELLLRLVIIKPKQNLLSLVKKPRQMVAPSQLWLLKLVLLVPSCVQRCSVTLGHSSNIKISYNISQKIFI